MELWCGVEGLELGCGVGMEVELWSRRCRVWSRGVWACVHQWNFDVRLKETCVFLLC